MDEPAQTTQRGAVTRILQAMGRGERACGEELLDLVYAELHRIAERQMGGERPGHTLQSTALVNEAYVRLLGEQSSDWQNRAHFFAAAAEAMRRILIDQARRRRAAKRGGGARAGELHDAIASPVAADDSSVDILALNDALSRLQEQDDRMALIVKLRYFTELSVDETASALNISRRTVIRDWIAAKAWLRRELVGPRDD